VITGCLLLFLPVFRKLDAKQPEKTFWKTSLWGLIPLLMYPALIVLFCIMIITIPLAVVLILAFFPLVLLANVIGTTLVGKYLTAKFKWHVEKRHYQFLIGALAGGIVSIIPFVNFLFTLFILSLGWGVYLSFLFNKDLTLADSKS
jgi:tetrahydromethanopterin S-methyltransferase subunit E